MISAPQPRAIPVSGGVVQVRDFGGSDGPTLVFMPSLGRGSADFVMVAAGLIERGYRVIGVDPRGVGDSSPVPPEATLHTLAADAAEVIRWTGENQVHLCGHAFGNRVARCAAADYPDLVRSVTLLAAGGLIPPAPEVVAAMRTSFAADTSEADRAQAVGAAFFAPGNKPRAEWVGGWWPEGASAQTAATQRTDVEDWWAAGQAPVLVIQGLDDRVAVPENGRKLVARLGDRARLVELVDAGHALLAEQPDRIIQAMGVFLDEQQAGDPVT